MITSQEKTIATLTKCCNEYAELVKAQQNLIENYENILMPIKPELVENIKYTIVHDYKYKTN